MNQPLRARAISLTLAFLLGAAVISCASAGGGGTPASSASQMDTTELRRTEFHTVYDAVKALHPDWLVARGGPTSINNSARQTPVVGVFLDGGSRGYPLDKLTEYVGSDVRRLRRISSSESLATFGPDWPWGGILVTLAH